MVRRAGLLRRRDRCRGGEAAGTVAWEAGRDGSEAAGVAGRSEAAGLLEPAILLAAGAA